MPKKLKTLLSIAGSDPMGGAGIQADIQAGSSLGVHVMTAITAVTAQNSKGLKQLNPVSSEILKAQLDCVFEDTFPDAIKIGLIGSIENIYYISNYLKEMPSNIPVVIDPVLSVSADNSPVYNENNIAQLYIDLLNPYSSVICPNLDELKIFLKPENSDIISITDSLLQKLRVKAIILTGGHTNEDVIEDLLINDTAIHTEKHPRIQCHNLHGTGCIFSTFLASFQALGFSLEDAFRLSSKRIFEKISQSCDYTLGNSIYGPININLYKL